MSAVCRGNAVTETITGTGGFSVAIAPDGTRAAAESVIFWIWWFRGRCDLWWRGDPAGELKPMSERVVELPGQTRDARRGQVCIGAGVEQGSDRALVIDSELVVLDLGDDDTSFRELRSKIA
jgi:hypothetical protein